MAPATEGIQVNEELEALGNELEGQNFELQSWWDLADLGQHWTSIPLPICLCPLIVPVNANMIKI